MSRQRSARLSAEKWIRVSCFKETAQLRIPGKKNLKSKVGKERVFERCREYLMGEAREKSCRPHPEPAASQAPAHTVVCVMVSQSKHGNGNASFFFFFG